MLSRSPLAHLSVIVPVAENEVAWSALARDLASLPPGAEVIFSGPRPPCSTSGVTLPPGIRVSWVRSRAGRGAQLNTGAAAATRSFLWFLHADSRLLPDGFAALERALQQKPRHLHYFDLRFSGDGPAAMRVNEWGVQLRSRLLGLPFGDQGFCLHRDVFAQVGPFEEAAPYGEDHLFVWAAARCLVPLHAVGAVLSTSARKYRDRGWAATTGRHLWLTFVQAYDQWRRSGRVLPSLTGVRKAPPSRKEAS